MHDNETASTEGTEAHNAGSAGVVAALGVEWKKFS
jgi:hypothetical protein